MKDNRKARRRPIRYTAWLVAAAGELQVCTLSDISETGARIDVQSADDLPDHFLLWLAANGSARRTCSVVWRKAKQIGVKFEQPLAEGDRASLVPDLAGDTGGKTVSAKAAEDA
jgi:hypothetical protein